MRVAAICFCLLGVALSVAVGPGLSLTRCLLTGEVRLSCCCAESRPAGIEAPDDCCQFQHLEQAWSAGLVSDHCALPPQAVTVPAPTLLVGMRLVSAVAPSPFASPPGVLRAMRI